MFESQRGFDEPGDACRGVQMAHVGFERADRRRAAPSGIPKGLRQSAHFNGIAHPRAGAVRFNIRNAGGGDAGVIQRFANHLGLALHAGCEIADFARAVVVDCRTENDRANVIVVGERILKPAQDNDAEAARENRTAGVGVEGPAVAVARKNLALAINVAAPVRNFDGDTARESHVALKIEQALAGHVRRDQRSRAGGLHIDAGSAQIELVTDARRQHVFIVAGLLELKKSCGCKQTSVGEQIVDQVGVHPRPGKDADGAGELLRRMRRVFQRLPRALQKMPVLRIHDGGIARAKTEERRVEERHVLENGGAAHVVGVGEILGRGAGGEQLGVRQVANGFDAVAQIPPELCGVACPGKTARHADDCDGRRFHGAVVSRWRAILRRAARSESWLTAACTPTDWLADCASRCAASALTVVN